MNTVMNQEITEKYAIYNADCVECAKSLPSDSIDFSIFSPPFETLYTYSNIDRDMGNSKDSAEFWTHYRFLIAEQFRIHKPGRLVAIHCMNLPTSKAMHGYIGIRDFRGEIIRAYEEAGFYYHSEVCIWKDPVTAMQRTKALGLLYKQLRKDSAMSRQGIPDYLVVFRKPGENPDPVTKTHDGFPVDKWQQYASPVWMDINPSRTLQYMSARDPSDERHIAPLQLDVIERAIELWTNPNDLVYTPFLGIGSEVYCAVKMGRRGIGSELKPSYFKVAVDNCRAAFQELKDEGISLFSGEAA
jgi:DNA modification methylase